MPLHSKMDAHLITRVQTSTFTQHQLKLKLDHAEYKVYTVAREHNCIYLFILFKFPMSNFTLQHIKQMHCPTPVLWHSISLAQLEKNVNVIDFL